MPNTSTAKSLKPMSALSIRRTKDLKKFIGKVCVFNPNAVSWPMWARRYFIVSKNEDGAWPETPPVSRAGFFPQLELENGASGLIIDVGRKIKYRDWADSVGEEYTEEVEVIYLLVGDATILEIPRNDLADSLFAVYSAR